MNKPLTLIDALRGKQSPIAHLPYHLVCNTCGRDHGFVGGYPKTLICFECEQPVEYKSNPEYVRPSMMTFQVPT